MSERRDARRYAAAQQNSKFRWLRAPATNPSFSRLTPRCPAMPGRSNQRAAGLFQTDFPTVKPPVEIGTDARRSHI